MGNIPRSFVVSHNKSMVAQELTRASGPVSTLTQPQFYGTEYFFVKITLLGPIDVFSDAKFIYWYWCCTPGVHMIRMSLSTRLSPFLEGKRRDAAKPLV